MSNPIDIQAATRKWFEQAINEILGDYRSFLDRNENITLSALKETCCGEPCVTIEGATDDTSKSFRLAGIYNTSKEHAISYILGIASLLAESGRKVILEGNEIGSNEMVADLFSNSSIDLKVRQVDTRWEIIYSSMDEHDWKVFCAFVPSANNSEISETAALTGERSLGLILAALGKMIKTDCGTKINPYGLVSLFPEIDQAQQVPQETKPVSDDF